jgi:putative transposase
MDFVHDQLLDGRRFRVLTVIDQWSCESVSVEAGFSLSGQSVAEILDHVARQRPLPTAITVDHGTEFTSRALDDWAWRATRLRSAREARRERPMRVVQRQAS